MGTQPPPVTQAVVYARAVSILTSRMFWLNTIALVVAIVELTELRDVIPDQYESHLAALVAVGNIILRKLTTRPVALIAPGKVSIVALPKIGPPAPPGITD